jgi:hypothetical protein
MARKGQKDSVRTSLEEYDPQIRKLGMDRFLSGEQLFNSKTHKLQPRYAELTVTQQRGVLLWAQQYAKKHHKQIRLYAQEKRLLAKIFRADGTMIAIAFAASLVGTILILMGANLIDADKDGVADIVQFLVTFR